MSHPDPSKDYHDDKPFDNQGAVRKFCNKCKKFLKAGKAMKNHRKGFEHKTGSESSTQAWFN